MKSVIGKIPFVPKFIYFVIRVIFRIKLQILKCLIDILELIVRFSQGKDLIFKDFFKLFLISVKNIGDIKHLTCLYIIVISCCSVHSMGPAGIFTGIVVYA